MLRTRATCAAFLLAVPVTAQAGQPAPATPLWQVDFGRHYCSMIRAAGEGRPFTTAFIVIPGGVGTEIMLIPEAGAQLPRRIDRLVLMPGGRTIDLVTAEEGRRGGRPVLSLGGPDFRLRDLLAAASELRLQAGDEVVARIPLAGARAAVAAHHRCTAQVSREWGVDEAALEALAVLPNSTNRLDFREDDYPTSALAAGTQGQVSIRLTVTAEGRVGDCNVVLSSGNAAIDERSCLVARRRGRFRPARDRAGRRVAIPVIYSIAWVIPGR